MPMKRGLIAPKTPRFASSPMQSDQHVYASHPIQAQVRQNTSQQGSPEPPDATMQPVDAALSQRLIRSPFSTRGPKRSIKPQGGKI